MIQPIKLHHRTLELPLIQGGMGVGVSLSRLAGHVMAKGAMGVISAAHPGYRKPSFWKDPLSCNLTAIKEEVAKANAISQGRGLCGVNIMVASHHYEEYVQAAVDARAVAIISGAGIPMDLPKYVKDSDILLAPIVSSGRVAKLILRAWDKRYQRIPDFIVIEGALAGGHLGFTLEELQNDSAQSLEAILQEVIQIIKPYETAYGRAIPLFVAGGIFDGTDIAGMLSLGASGVQMATRFIATVECDADDAYKQVFLSATDKELQLVNSPAGLPGRAITTAFTKQLQEGRIPPSHCIGCMKPCHPQDTPYCISEALIHAVSGDVDHGLVFAGANAGRITELTTVSELIDELMKEMEAAG